MLFVDYNKPVRTNFIDAYTCIYYNIVSVNTWEIQAGSLLPNGTMSLCYSIHFYTNICVLISVMMHTWCDVKLQIIKTPKKPKPNRRYHQITHANLYCTKLQCKHKLLFHCRLSLTTRVCWGWHRYMEIFTLLNVTIGHICSYKACDVDIIKSSITTLQQTS